MHVNLRLRICCICGKRGDEINKKGGYQLLEVNLRQHYKKTISTNEKGLTNDRIKKRGLKI